MNVYILETGQIQEDGSFFWYGIEIFSSMQKLKHRVNKSININNGYGVVWYNAPVTWDPYRYVDYQCLSTDDKEMDVFLRYIKKVVK